LKGTASSKNFLNYTLEYSTDMDTINPTWVPIGTFYKAIEDGLILDNFDSSRLPDGKLVVRLRVQDRNGEESQDLIDINFDNVRLISPRTEDDLEIIDDPIYHLGMVLLTNYQTSTLGNMLMPVVVDIFGQTSSFVINVIDASTGNAITETGLLSYIRDKSTLGRVDTSKLPHPGLYKLQIIKNNSIAATTDFIYEPRLVKPEPLRILEDPWQLLSGHFKVIDFNNDGVDEILLGEGKIRVLSNSNIILEHSFSDGFESFASPLAADLDGDGNKELISPLYGYNGSKFIHKISVVNKDGKELPQWEQHPGDYSFETMIGDVNFDGKSDIISVSALYTSVDTNSISIYLTSSFLGSDNAVHQESHLLASNIYVMDVIIGDFDGNGKEEIALLVSDMDDGKEAIMIFSLNGDLIKTISIRVGRNLLGLIAADVDQDHDLEFIVGGYSINSSGFYSSEDSTFMINVLNWWNMSQLAIGDLNNDGFPEIVFGANQVSYVAPEDYHNDYLFALNRDGQLLPNYPVTRGISFNRLLTIMFPLLGTPPSSIAIADVDNDGKCDIITAMEPDKNTRAVIFAYKDDGTLVKGFPLHAGNTAPRTFAQTPNAMAVGNFDKDPGLELVFADTLKYVYIYNLDTPATAKVEWGMYRSDVENTGVYYKKGKPRPKADLGVQILADKSSVTTGDIFTLGLQVRNNLNLTKGWTGTAYGVMTSMDIPVGLTPVNIDGRCSIKDNKLVCNFETMLPGMMKNLYAQFKATNSQLKDMEVSIGGASVTATSKLLSQISVDPNISNNISNMVKVLVKQKRADLSITTFTTNKASYLKGEDVILTVAAANNIGLGFGVVNNTAYGVVLKIPQPEFLVFDPSKQDPNQNCALVNKEIVCQLGNMPVLLGTVKRTIKFSIPANSTVGTRDLSIGTATVVATSTLADQITIDPNSNNNTKYTSISIVQYADLVADIKASNSSYRYNENIPLILSVQNKQDVAKSYISDAYNVITRMVVPPSYDYIGDNPDCAMDSTRVLTCNFSTLKSNASTTRVVTLKPLILRAGLKVLNFSLNTSSQATVPTQKTIDPLVLNNSKNLVLTAQ
jgi:hypothetical protein